MGMLSKLDQQELIAELSQVIHVVRCADCDVMIRSDHKSAWSAATEFYELGWRVIVGHPTATRRYHMRCPACIKKIHGHRRARPRLRLVGQESGEEPYDIFD